MMASSLIGVGFEDACYAGFPLASMQSRIIWIAVAETAEIILTYIFLATIYYHGNNKHHKWQFFENHFYIWGIS